MLNNIKKPISTTLHTVNVHMPKNREIIFNNIIKRSNLIFVFSIEAKNFIVNSFNIEKSKITVIPHGTPDGISKVPKNNGTNERNSECVNFVSSGLMRETKGYDIAIKALSILKNEINKIHYYIIGANHPQNETAIKYRNELSKLINDLNLKDNITFISEYLPQKELNNLIQNADISLIPYPVKEQSSSGVLALMIACGRPIVTTPFQFAKSIITEKSGMIAKSCLPEDFADGIRSLLEKKDSWGEIINHNYKLGELWCWSNIAKYYLNQYSKLKGSGEKFSPAR